MGNSAAYEAAGVNLEAGNEASSLAFSITQTTWGNRAGRFGMPETFSDGFRGVRGNSFEALHELKLEHPDAEFIDYLCSDGAGNKPKVAQRVGKHDTIGEDVVAMASDDATALGAEAVSLANVLVVNTLGKKDDHPNKLERLKRNEQEVFQGLANGANKAELAIVNGETAEHGEGVDGYGEFRYDLSATVLWVALKGRLLTGKNIKSGDAFVALGDTSFGCNGYSLLLKTLEQVYGYEWHHQPFGEDSTWGEELLKPSVIYSGLYSALTGGFNPNRQPIAEIGALTHHTGGGMVEKISSKLGGLGIGVVLNDLFEPTDAMHAFQSLAGIDDEEMHHVFHMGQRGGVITPNPDEVIAEATQRGIQAQIAGEVTNKPELVIASRGNDKAGNLTFPIPQ